MTTWAVAVTVAVLALVTVACGVHRQESLPAGGPVQTGTLTTYGWSSLDLAQDIEVTLFPAVALSDVVDLSVFGGFTPGLTADEAQSLKGAPARTRQDSWGETWQVYELPKSNVEVGCQYYASGNTPSACFWTLHAVPKMDPRDVLLEPRFHDYLDRGVRAQARVSIRSVEVSTADRIERVKLYLKSRIGPGVYWSDQRKAARRDGLPRTAAQQALEADGASGRRPR